MFNSPINPLPGIQPAGQDGQKHNQTNQEDTHQNKKQGKSSDTIFSNENDLELYTDIINENFTPEDYIKTYFDNLLEEYKNEQEKLFCIEKFLSRFNIKKFVKKCGSNLSKEDLNAILYEICKEAGL